MGLLPDLPSSLGAERGFARKEPRFQGVRTNAYVGAIVALGFRTMKTSKILGMLVGSGFAVLVGCNGSGSGDGAQTINVSTGAAIVVAACGVRVAKHGNRAISSRCGSADVIEALGIPTDLTAEKQSMVLKAAGIAFLMAPAHHPALRHAAVARRELGVRTIFNALGPLVNPARATHQLRS